MVYSTISAVNVTTATTITAYATKNPICECESVTLTANAGMPGGENPGSFTGGDFGNSSIPGWLSDSNPNINTANNNETENGWGRTTNPRVLSGITYNSSQDGKYMSVYDAPGLINNLTSVLETPEFSLFGLEYAELAWFQGMHLTAGATARIEIFAGGVITILAQWNGPVDITPTNGLASQTPIPLTQWLGMSDLRIRYVFEGRAGSSWAIDGISLNPGGGTTFPAPVYEWHPPTGEIFTGISNTVSPSTTTTYDLDVYFPKTGTDARCYLGTTSITITVEEITDNNTNAVIGTESVPCIDLAVQPVPGPLSVTKNSCSWSMTNPTIEAGLNPTDLCGGQKTYTFTYTACDGTKFYREYVYTINDNIRPSITAPTTPRDVGSCTEDGKYVHSGPDWNYLSANDNCSTPTISYSLTGDTDSNGEISSTTLNGATFNEGTTTVTWIATDACGNSNSSSFVVNVGQLHYRTTKTDDWIFATTWETSPDRINWGTPARCFPVAGNSKSIQVMYGHEVTVKNGENIPVDAVTVHAGGMVTVDLGGTLNNTGSLGAADFVIESEAPASGGYGSLIAYGNFIGQVSYNLWTTNVGCPEYNDRAYIISSPVSGQDAGVLRTNGLSGIREYNESINDWGGNISGNLFPGKGYAAYRDGNPGITPFRGIPNVGLIPVQVSSSYFRYGWNSVGNPYTSALKIRPEDNDFLLTNLSTLHEGYGAIYLWDEGKCNYSVINLINYPVEIWNPDWNSETWYDFEYETVDDIVQVGQGFLVNIKWPNPGKDIIFQSGMQTHSTSTTLKKASTSWPGLTLVAKNGTSFDKTIVTFYEDGTTGLDPGYDAGVLSVNPFQLYTNLVTGKDSLNLAIQTLPDNQYDQLVIPVGINCPEGGNITFVAGGVILPNGLYPTLEDKLLNISTPLKNISDSYTANVPADTYGTGRFYLKFGNVTPSEVIQQPEVRYSARFEQNKFVIFGNTGRDSKASLFDINGRKIGEYRLINENLNEIPAQNLVNGVYLLHIQNDQGSQVIKVPVVYE